MLKGREKMSKKRNPFPQIGKVIKYEFKHSSRILLPLYGILLVLGLLTGLSFNNHNFDSILNELEKTGSYNGNVQIVNGILSGLLILAVCILATATTIITLVTLARRFKQGMLGDESYLNLSLPVTMGEHLWGRFIMDFLWFVLNYIVIFLTGMLCCIKIGIPRIFKYFAKAIPEIQLGLAKNNVTMGQAFGVFAANFLVSMIWIITLIFIVNAISLLFKNMKGIVKFIVVILLIFITTKCQTLVINFNSFTTMSNFMNSNLINSAVMFGFSVLYFAATQFIFTKKLNLD